MNDFENKPSYGSHLYMWLTHHGVTSVTVRPLSLLSLLCCAPYWMDWGKTALSGLSTVPFTLLFVVVVVFRKYSTITALEQRQQYKDDFCAEYDEYRALHDRIGAITEMFVQLGSKINTLSPGTQEYKVLVWTRSFPLLCSHLTLTQIRNTTP